MNMTHLACQTIIWPTALISLALTWIIYSQRAGYRALMAALLVLTGASVIDGYAWAGLVFLLVFLLVFADSIRSWDNEQARLDTAKYLPKWMKATVGTDSALAAMQPGSIPRVSASRPYVLDSAVGRHRPSRVAERITITGEFELIDKS